MIQLRTRAATAALALLLAIAPARAAEAGPCPEEISGAVGDEEIRGWLVGSRTGPVMVWTGTFVFLGYTGVGTYIMSDGSMLFVACFGLEA